MNRENIQEKDYNMSDTVHQPELALIIEKLQRAVYRYDDILWETHQRLQAIKKYEEPLTFNEHSKEPAETAIEELNRLLLRLNDLNDMAERNLLHLRDIV